MSNNILPDMSYKRDRERNRDYQPTEFERYADHSVTAFLRQYRREAPNHRWDVDISIAARLSRAIDEVETYPNMMHQIIWSITHPQDCHPDHAWLVDNQSTIQLLLLRHYKAHGGMVLPPLAPAREVEAQYTQIRIRESGNVMGRYPPNFTQIVYPAWRGSQYEPLSSNSTSRGGRASSGERGGFGGGF